ncbi:MAG: hypothetical protein R3F40_09080 [Candidatus Competibacteraceae bacterium]
MDRIGAQPPVAATGFAAVRQEGERRDGQVGIDGSGQAEQFEQRCIQGGRHGVGIGASQ